LEPVKKLRQTRVGDRLRYKVRKKMDIKPIRNKWKSAMTDRERFNRQMHYQSVDRCFNMEFGYWDDNFTLWDIFRDNGIKTNEEADVFFSFDRIESIGGATFMCPPIEQRELEIRDNKRIIINEDGLLAEVPLESGGSSIPHFLKSSITSPEDWKKVKEEHFDINSPGRIIDLGALKKRIPDDEHRDFPLGVWCGSMIGKVRDMLTFEGLAYACYDYPEMVEEMVETCCQMVEYALDQLLPHFKFDYASGWEDICFNHGPIVSLDFFRDVVTPRYKRINKKLKAYGIDIWYTDCDGDVRPILPHLLEGGINCLFPYEVNSCAHPGELLDQYQGELRIMGGVDKMRMGEGKEAIRDYLRSLEKYVVRGGYIPFCDHRCPPNVTPEDYLYYLTLKEKMFGMG
jgi:uroporphyrinogen decarboxylase